MGHILRKSRRLDPVAAFVNENKCNCSASQHRSDNAKLSTAFDVIHKFILLFAWDVPEIGFTGTAVSRFHRCAIVLICASDAPCSRIGQSDGSDEYRLTLENLYS